MHNHGLYSTNDPERLNERKHNSGAPAAIWSMVRRYDADEWGGGVITI